MIVKAYLFIPHSKQETQLFLHVRTMCAWWMPGAIAFGFVPAAYLAVLLASMVVDKFKRFDYERFQDEIVIPKARKYSYYLFWILYTVWIPLPWPRAAVLTWAILLYWRTKAYLKKRERRMKWFATLDKADLALIEGADKWLERQHRIDRFFGRLFGSTPQSHD